MLTADGVFLSKAEFGLSRITGWVATRHSCHYGHTRHEDWHLLTHP
ncbi:hypothetical protein [Litoreibacter arenae]|uniref:Uncharacterized protein n=1 Tax=Litoreibacter arenae DSM 19593 TaxID=1123360 RepID=S9QM60_9RHOB|nr:hypothetical protein [Litoreibacter arenae]EPX80842.1 hypothetical protein thalar_01064 [Litoreibacter arenae DSM 19593]